MLILWSHFNACACNLRLHIGGERNEIYRVDIYKNKINFKMFCIFYFTFNYVCCIFLMLYTGFGGKFTQYLLKYFLCD